MSKKHSKKRNVGLVYEFLVRAISTALLEGDNKKSARALKIMKRYFKPGTELYNEFRLIHSLRSITVSSDAVAATIIERARQVAKTHDASRLMREKSLLIREINHGLNDQSFYDQPVSEYRIYATIQSLIDEWRSPTGDIKLLAEYEDKLIKWMSSSKPTTTPVQLSEEDAGTQRLLVKAMTQKLNEKYAAVLNSTQKSILREYGLSVDTDKRQLTTLLEDVKRTALETLDTAKTKPEDVELTAKLAEIRDMLSAETLTEINDDTIVRFMLYTKFIDELKGAENV